MISGDYYRSSELSLDGFGTASLGSYAMIILPITESGKTPNWCRSGQLLHHPVYRHWRRGLILKIPPEFLSTTLRQFDSASPAGPKWIRSLRPLAVVVTSSMQPNCGLVRLVPDGIPLHPAYRSIPRRPRRCGRMNKILWRRPARHALLLLSV